MKIIEATKKDIPTLIMLNNEAQVHHINLDPKIYKKTCKVELSAWFERLFVDENVKILIASINSKPISYAIARIVEKEENPFKYPQHFMLIDHISVKKVYRNRGYGKKLLEEIKQYAENFSFDEKFDYVFSFHALHWVKDKLKVFKNVYTHLKPGGKFIFLAGGGRKNPAIANVFYSEKWQKLMSGYGPKFHFFDKNETKSILLEAGFSIEELKAEFWPQYYSKEEELVNWMMGWVPFATGFDKKTAIAFANEIAENIINENIVSGITDKIEYKAGILAVKALKGQLKSE